jgi:hypothetical protein
VCHGASTVFCGYITHGSASHIRSGRRGLLLGNESVHLIDSGDSSLLNLGGSNHSAPRNLATESGLCYGSVLDQVVDGQVAILCCALETRVPILRPGNPSRARRYPEAFQD